MTRQHLSTIAIGVLVLASTTPRAQAQTTAPGPYYATPSWDMTLPTNTRFIVLSNFNNAAVLDRETGLVWERFPTQVPFEWELAAAICTTRQIANRFGWRLPTIHELSSLIDAGQPFPSEPLNNTFGALVFNAYWSTTNLARLPSFAYVADLRTSALSVIDKSTSLGVGWLCVRGGGGADGQ